MTTRINDGDSRTLAAASGSSRGAGSSRRSSKTYFRAPADFAADSTTRFRRDATWLAGHHPAREQPLPASRAQLVAGHHDEQGEGAGVTGPRGAMAAELAGSAGAGMWSSRSARGVIVPKTGPRSWMRLLRGVREKVRSEGARHG